MTKYNFFIPTRLPSMNEIIDEARGSKFASAIQKTKYTKLVADVVRLTFRKYGTIQGKVWLSFIWVERNRRRDPGNIRCGEKFITDGLVRAGLLQGDGWKQIAGFTDTWEVGKEAGVWVEVREV